LAIFPAVPNLFDGLTDFRSRRGRRHSLQSDNTFGRILAWIKWQEMQMRLWWQVRGFRERHQLGDDILPIPTLAFDGKTAASGDKKMSRFAQRQVHKDKDDNGKVIRKRTYYKLHVLRAVLTSCRQKICVWQHPVRSKKNEITGMKTVVNHIPEEYT